MRYISIRLKVLDSSNRILYVWPSWVSVAIPVEFSEIIGEFRTRDAEFRRRAGRSSVGWFDISGPGRIVTLERKWSRLSMRYVTSRECRRLADKLYASGARFKPWGKLRFVKMADIFSLGSIMNGVVI